MLLRLGYEMTARSNPTGIIENTGPSSSSSNLLRADGSSFLLLANTTDRLRRI